MQKEAQYCSVHESNHGAHAKREITPTLAFEKPSIIFTPDINYNGPIYLN